MKKADRKLRRKAGTIAKKQRRQARISSQAAVVTRVEFNWMNPWTWFRRVA